MDSVQSPVRTQCFVGNLRSDVPKTMLEDKLRASFESLGIFVCSVDVCRRNGKKPTHAFVDLASKSDLENAITNADRFDQKLVFDGKIIRVAPRDQKGSDAQDAAKERQKFRNKGKQKGKLKVQSIGTRKMMSLHNPSGNKPPPIVSQNTSPYLQHKHSNKVDNGEGYIIGQKLGTEDRLTEYKRGGGNYLVKRMRSYINEYVCAFLNSEGGRLLIGVEDDCKVCGVECSDQMEDQLRQELDSVIKRFKPPVLPNMYRVNFKSVYKSLSDVTVENGAPVLTESMFPGSNNESVPGPSGLNNRNGVILELTSLKVIELKVDKPKKCPSLYENEEGVVYIRRDGSIQRLRASEIQEWLRQNASDSHVKVLQMENESLKTECQKKDRIITRISEQNENLERQTLSKSKSAVCTLL
ncbi:schlafen-like protein 1 [Nematostella vectensis]|uniref:schlafen-like protein 1 n=1 Tax=Nematostella vectensis TaxID=45351 RepID=UPI0020779A14|nr:schlafen-like protein 1 [Nematostella vectensis]